MSEFINNATKRKEALKEVIRKLHAGKSVESLQEEFNEIIEYATASDIAEAEREIIAEGMPVSDIQKMCDLHVAVFQAGLESQAPPESLPGHPVFDYRLENEVIGRVLESLEALEEPLRYKQHEAHEKMRNAAQNLDVVLKHYEIKENVWFPHLERHGFEGPAKVMWGVHNDIRKEIKEFLAALEAEPFDWDDFSSALIVMVQDIREMIYKEEKVLIPEALARLTPEEWEMVKEESQSDSARGYRQPKAEQPQPETRAESSSEHIFLNTGMLTAEQINLLLTHLPVDITLVDENDEVRFFSQTQERIFPRTASIIGRSVQNCHPPQSVHVVQRILDDFKSGKRNVAEFWIQMQGKFVHIRYFALRNSEGVYKGTIEVTQDISEIRALEGERRLLDDLN